MFNKKQNKTPEPFTPRDLDALNAKGWHNSRGIKRDAKEMTKDQKRRRTARWLIVIIIAIIIILWLLSYCSTQYGDLVVSVDKNLEGKGVILSETPGFENPSVTLDGGSVKDVYHFTYDWFESRGVLDELDNIDGSHNGKDYFAYTFYIQNNGTETFDYNATLEVTGVAKSCDEAARIMVYKNGEPTIYAKPKLGTTDDAEFVSHDKSDKAVLFYDNDTVYTETLPDFSPGDVDKYSVVIWFEGEDSECINDIMGGHMRLAMNFEAAELEEN
ncbi:MAG: hypothetical protein E7566_03045 [Ruminococcaceae bacterium]|nr:hypothetical protein [Oscillospiraceae bacterium]